jgi:GGDEF domain-containing protein
MSRATRLALLSAPVWIGLLWAATRTENEVLPFAVGVAVVLFYGAQVLSAADQSQADFRVQLARIQEDLDRRLRLLDMSDAGISRRYVESRLEQEMKRSQRYRLPLTLVIMRTHSAASGLEAWQALTSEVMSAASRLLRTEDVFGHLEGPEFAVILPHTPRSQAEIVIGRLGAGLAAYSPAFGTADAGRPGATVDGLLSDARADLDARLAASPNARKRPARAA